MIKMIPSKETVLVHDFGDGNTNVYWAGLTDVEGEYIRFVSRSGGGNCKIFHHLDKEPTIILQSVNNGSLVVVSKNGSTITVTPDTNNQQYEILLF